MRVVAFRHSPSEDLGLIGGALSTYSMVSEYWDLCLGSELEPSIRDAAALIVLGGATSANDDLPFIHRELEFIRIAIQLGKPVLGVCLGAQMIAKALGANVYTNPSKEIGWNPVTFSTNARADPLFRGFDSEVIFHWHGETFDLPAGACLLASSAACRHQAFRVGDRIYGFQFHLEVTAAMILRWCAEDAVCGSREVTEPIDPYAHSARANSVAQTVFGRWCDLVKQRANGSR